MRHLKRFTIAIIALAGLHGPARAQQIETPVPFDSAGRVSTLTPQLVARYGLTAPAWPVSGSFVEARLYAVSSGGRVITVERLDGSVERHTITEAEALALRDAIMAGMTQRGATAVEARPDVISEPARNAFARNQMLLSLGLYGSLLASLANDGQTATALYLLGAGGSFFVSLGISRNMQVTRAQNHLATDGALRGYGATAAFLYTTGADLGHKTYSALGLAGALGGSLLGYQRGRGMSDVEAEAATTISTLAAAAGFGATAAFASIDNTDGRLPVATMLGAGLVGYALGPNYPRNASYIVTRGDVQMLSLGGVLGAAVALIPIVDSDVNLQAGFGLVTAGLLAGTYVADQALVRRFDYAMSDATQIQLATAAGALMGTAAVVLVEPSSASFAMALVTGGGILGAVAGHSFANPPRAGGSASRPGKDELGGRVQFDPTALALAASRAPGRHALVTVKF